MESVFRRAQSGWLSVDWRLPEDQAQVDTLPVSMAEKGPQSESNATPTPGKSFAVGATTGVATARQVTLDPALNSKYTFDNFVVGFLQPVCSCRIACRRRGAGKEPTTLYIYTRGRPGQDHLMHACGHEIKQRNPHLRVSISHPALHERIDQFDSL
jgi:chromosomal replication initiation ATPase DnaA